MLQNNGESQFRKVFPRMHLLSHCAGDAYGYTGLDKRFPVVGSGGAVPGGLG